MSVASSNVSPRFFRRGNEAEKLARFAPEIFFAAPRDVFQTAGGPIGDGGEDGGASGHAILFFQKSVTTGCRVGSHFNSCGRHRKSFGADVFAKGEEGMMSPQILLCRFHALVDLDLLHAGIALDVENAIAREQVVVEFLCAADVQDRVGLAIKLLDSSQSQARGRIAREITRAKGPAISEIEFARQRSSSLRRIIKLVVDVQTFPGCREAGPNLRCSKRRDRAVAGRRCNGCAAR